MNFAIINIKGKTSLWTGHLTFQHPKNYSKQQSMFDDHIRFASNTNDYLLCSE